LFAHLRCVELPRRDSNQSDFINEKPGISEQAEKPGHPPGQFEPSSEGQAIRQELLDALQFSWMTAGRLDLYTEETAERQKIERVQSQLSKMMRLVRGLATNKV